MLKPIALSLIFLVFFGSAVYAQPGTATAAYHPRIYFLKNDGHYVSTRDSADFIRVISDPDSGSTFYNVMEVYKNHKRKFIGKSSNSTRMVLEGRSLGFYENGNKKFVENYISGNPSGVCYYFYPNGRIYSVKEYITNVNKDKQEIDGGTNYSYLIKDCRDSTGKVLVKDGNGHYVGYNSYFNRIEEEGPVKDGKPDSTWVGTDSGLRIKFTEQYANGKLVLGTSTDSAGVTHIYLQRRVFPQYRGGQKAIARYLASHIEYPTSAKENDIQGTVFLSFIVKKDGKLIDIRIIRHIDDALDAEALRAVKSMPNWQPGVFYGVPINVSYSIPVTFALR